MIPSGHALSTISGLIENTGRVRRETMNGRDYLVAPLTLIVPGVLNGSKGSLYYPPDEVAKDPGAWNGMPLVVYHPTSLDGSPISGRDPRVIERQGIGYVYSTQYSRNKLQAEGWFDIEHTRRISPDTLTSIQAGRPVELSTGLFTDNYPAGRGNVHNSPTGPRPYDYIARNYRPDHVAILPNQVGACSIQDGCGVLVNQKGEVMDKEDVSSLFSRFWEWVTNTPNPNQPRSKVTGRLKPLGAGTGKGEAHEAAQAGYFGGVKDAKDSEEIDEDKDSEELELEDCSTSTSNRDFTQGHRDRLPPEDFAGPHQSFPIVTQEDVASASRLIGHASDPDAIKRRIISIARRKGLSLPDGWQESNQEATSQATTTTANTDTTTLESEPMALINLDTDLLTNAELGNNKEFSTDEERRAAFAAMSDAGGGNDKPVSTKEMTAQGGAGPRAHSGKGGVREASKLEGKGTESHSGKAGPSVSSSGGSKSEASAAASEASAAAVKRSALAKKAGGGADRKAREHRKAWTAHLEAATAHEGAGSHDIAAHHLKAADEHLASARHHEGTNNLAANLDIGDREILIERLITTNCACQGDRGSLAYLSDATLERMVGNAPPMMAKKPMGNDPMNGQGGHDDSLETSDPEDAVDQGVDEDTEDEQGNPIPPKQGMPNKSARAVGGGQSGSYGGTGNMRTMTVNEWMQVAPPEIRGAVHNAMEIEKAERMRLVQLLVANVQDPARRKHIAANLLTKDLGDLRERLELQGAAIPAPHYAPPTPLFNGAAGAPSYPNGGVTTNQEDDDILPLPTINWNDKQDTGHGGIQSMREAAD